MPPPAPPTGRTKSADAFRTIGEAAAEVGVEPHVLRFWETKFTRLKPLTRAGGRRYYRPADIDLLHRIKRLLHDDGLTIRGAQKLLQGRQSPDLLDALAKAEPAHTATEQADPAQDAPAAAGKQATLPRDVAGALAALAAEARSIANGGPIPPVRGTD
jgi:DNA-binding transcriptional MerR regulator